MNDKELQEWAESNWSRVDEDQRKKCVDHLRAVIPQDQQIEFKDMIENDSEPVGFHMFGGMAVRNTLREVMKDDELSAVPYEHIEGTPSYSNWDDYYTAALRQAVAPKEGEY